MEIHGKQIPSKTARILFSLFSLFVALSGIALVYGGVKLISAGGSLAFAMMGVVMLVLSWLLFRRKWLAVWVNAGLITGSLLWALYEVKLDGWALIPRLDWPVLFGLMMLGLTPCARHYFIRFHRKAWYLLTLVPVAACFTLVLVLLLNPSSIHLAEKAKKMDGAEKAFSTGTVDSPDHNIAANHDDTNWTAYAGSNLSNHYSPASQITPDNVGHLVKAWEFHTGDLPAPGEKTEYLNENTPLKVGDNVYVCTPTQQVIALDAASGREKWRFNPHADKKALFTAGAYCRGVAYFERNDVPAGAACHARILWGVTGGRLAAVDAQTGTLCEDFGDKGYVDLKKGIGDFTPGYFGNTSAPIVVRGKVIIGHMVRDGQDRYAPSGVVRAYDAVTGKFAWAWDLGRPGITSEPGPHEHYTPGTPNVWAPMSADDKLGLVYMGTGNAAGDFYGTERTPEEEEYTAALVAVDAGTGQVKWHFRTVNHDLWDFDIGPQPNLVDWPTPKGVRPAVIQATKSGQIFVLDRETGKPLMPVKELPVPQGADGGNWTAKTQPFSVGMPNTVGAPGKKAEVLDERVAWGMTPFDMLACRVQFKRARYDGMYTPPMLGGTIAYPGNHGGLNWGGVSVDLQQGMMVMNTNRLPYYEQLFTRDDINQAGSKSLNEHGRSLGYMPQVGLPVGAKKSPWLSAIGVPCIAPPWGYLTGVDLRTKEVVWQRPFGTGYDSGPFNIPSRIKLTMGTPSDSGALTTGGGVTLIGAALDNFMRAFDTRTGEQRWETRLPAGAQGAPLTYVQNGKQYVVAVVGGHQRLGTTLGDSVIAWTLPDNKKE